MNSLTLSHCSASNASPQTRSVGEGLALHAFFVVLAGRSVIIHLTARRNRPSVSTMQPILTSNFLISLVLAVPLKRKALSSSATEEASARKLPKRDSNQISHSMIQDVTATSSNSQGENPVPYPEVPVLRINADEDEGEAGGVGAVQNPPPPDADRLDALETMVAHLQKEVEAHKHQTIELQKLVGLLQGQLGILTTGLATSRA